MEDLQKNFEMKLLKKNDKVLKLTKPCGNYLPLCLLFSAHPLTHVHLLPRPLGVLPAGEAP